MVIKAPYGAFSFCLNTTIKAVMLLFYRYKKFTMYKAKNLGIL